LSPSAVAFINFILFIYLITSFSCPIFEILGRRQKLSHKNPKFPQNLRPINLLSTKGKLFEKVIMKVVQRHIEERGLLNASQFCFRARHSTTFQCMRLTDQVTLNFNSNMYVATAIMDIEKAFDTIWRLDLLYKLSKLKFSISSINLFISFLS
jgi:hypothetical protein